MRFKLVWLLALCSMSLFAQIRSDVLDEQMFDYRVKGIGEFMARFNSDEHLKFDMHFPDSLGQRERDLISVCNYEMGRSIPGFEGIFKGFSDSIRSNDIKLDFTDAEWFAGARCKAQYNDTPIALDLLLTPHQARPGRYCWTLLDVGGSGVNNLADTTKWVAISPTDNELDFIELAGKTKSHRRNFPGFRKPGREIDYLSAFVALVQAGVVSVNHCEKITYYFLNVPGYIFTVDYFSRENPISGWLISSIIPVDDESKKDMYLRMLFNLPNQ